MNRFSPKFNQFVNIIFSKQDTNYFLNATESPIGVIFCQVAEPNDGFESKF